MHPVLDKIVVKPIVEQTNSKIEMPDAYKRRPSKGKVVAVGTGTKDEPMRIEVGETILHEPLAGKEVTIEGETYLVMKQADVLIRL